MAELMDENPYRAPQANEPSGTDSLPRRITPPSAIWFVWLHVLVAILGLLVAMVLG